MFILPYKANPCVVWLQLVLLTEVWRELLHKQLWALEIFSQYWYWKEFNENHSSVSVLRWKSELRGNFDFA